jgi:hypothetical protein
MYSSIDFPTSIGKIVSNLQSLEFALRLVRYEFESAVGPPIGVPLGTGSLTVGAWVPETSLTDYDTLKQVIRKVNSILKSRGLRDRVDESLVDLRDALAHGRVMADVRQGPFHIFKFSKPRCGKVQVTVSIEMTPDWLAQQIKRTADELRKVVEVGRALGLKCFPDK